MTDIDILLPNSNEDNDTSSLKDKKVNEELPDLPKCSIMHLLLRFGPCWVLLMTLSWIAPILIFSILDIGKALNPCNARDPQTFQSFVTEWKQRNEAEEELNHWKKDVQYSDIYPVTKRYFEQKIQISTAKIEALNATLNPQYHMYENCFLTNANSKLNINFIYWTAAYLTFAFGSVLIYFSVKYYRKRLETNNLYNKNVLLDFRSAESAAKFLVLVCTCYSLLPYITLYVIMRQDVSTEFVI